MGEVIRLSGIFVNRFLISVCLVCAVNISAAQLSILGENCVIPLTEQGYVYRIFGGSGTPQWCVIGGDIVDINGNIDILNNPCIVGPTTVRIRWLPNQSVCSLRLVRGTQNTSFVVKAANWSTITPYEQTLNYGASLVASGTTAFSGTNCSGSYAYQWELSDSYDGPFSPIDGATGQNLNSGTLTEDSYIRRKTTVSTNPLNGTKVGYSNIVEMLVTPIDAGSITLSENPDFNSVADITNTAATGGFCFSTDYVYEWEQSVSNGPWVSIGTGQSYPINAPATVGKTSVRRKVTCGNQSVFSNVLEIIPEYSSLNAENLSYVRTNTIAIAGVQTWEESDQLSIGQKFQTTQYMDGLSRIVQTVNASISIDENESWNDMVNIKDYNKLGLQINQYLPYPSTSLPGKFKTGAITEQSDYYQSTYADINSFAIKTFEKSPLQHVLKQEAPGAEWSGAGVGTQKDYNINDGNSLAEKVHIWNVEYAENSIPVTSSTLVYQEGTLFKVTTTDENGKRMIEYSDIRGRIVLIKKQELNSGAGLTNEHQGWLCTYYVYDDFDRIRYVITPKAVEYLEGNNWVLNQDISDELCFSYFYDKKGRMILKKSPGVQPLYIAYDLRNRPVFTQDGNQRNDGKWLLNIYEENDRLAAKGLYRTSKSRSVLQEELDNSSTNILSVTGVSTPVRLLNVSEQELETYFIPDIFIYYDDYLFAGVKSFYANFQNLEAYSNSEPEIQPIAKTNFVLGMITGSKVRVLGTSTFLLSTYFYDQEGRLLQKISDNYKGGEDIITNQYHFDGRVMSVHTRHSIGGADPLDVITKNEYDIIGRVSKLHKKYGLAAFKQLAVYKYDEFGRLRKKDLGTRPGHPFPPMETVNYSYNIRGWLDGINKDYALTSDDNKQWDNHFGMYLGYQKTEGLFSGVQYNGNITGVIWKTMGDNTPRKYNYSYDNAGRYIEASFTQKEKPSEISWTSNKMDFSVDNIQYDKNGNLVQLFKKGVLPGESPVYIDKLKYYYKTVAGGQYSNVLTKVFDDGSALDHVKNGILGDFKDETYNINNDDYSYDSNGNLLKDNNKKIRNGVNSGIEWNYYDKPQKIILEDQSTVEFTYDANGKKISKKVTPAGGGAATTIWYIGEFVYKNDDLKFIFNEEGRFRILDNEPWTNSPLGTAEIAIFNASEIVDYKWGMYDYFLKDNAGNVRMVITEERADEKYVCTMESGPADEEVQFFGQMNSNGTVHPNNEVNSTRFDKTSSNWSNNSSDKICKLYSTANNTGKTIGPNILLKVMAGDVAFGAVNFYYDNIAPTNNYDIAQSMIASFISAFSSSGLMSSAVLGNHGAVQAALSDPVSSPLLNFLPSRPVQASGKPRAYMNFIFFDENFNYVPVSNGSIPVYSFINESTLYGAPQAPKNGFVYVFLSNESNQPVYFDDFTVIVTKEGGIVEESHYYPDGMKIASLGGKAFNKPVNRFGFQGDFSEEDEESGYNEFELRNYDPQIGRWIGTDPYDQFASPYAAMANNPVNNIDRDGGWSSGFTGALLGAAGLGITGYIVAQNQPGMKWWQSGLIGLGSSLLGAGLGYGVGETWFGSNDWHSGSFLGNVRAFYTALADFDGSMAGNEIGKTGPFCGNANFATIPRIYAGLNFNFWQEGVSKKIESTLVQGPTLLRNFITDYTLLDYPIYNILINLPATDDTYRLDISGTGINLSDYNISPSPSNLPSGPSNIRVQPNVLDIQKRENQAQILDRQFEQSGGDATPFRENRARGRRDLFQGNNNGAVKIFRDHVIETPIEYLKIGIPLKFIRRKR